MRAASTSGGEEVHSTRARRAWCVPSEPARRDRLGDRAAGPAFESATTVAQNCAHHSIGRLALAGVVCAVACGCGAAAAGDATPSWSFSPEGYFSDRSFAESFFSADVALIHNRGDFGGELVALERARWLGPLASLRELDGAIRPGASIRCWIVDDPPNQEHAQLVRIDAASGQETHPGCRARPRD